MLIFQKLTSLTQLKGGQFGFTVVGAGVGGPYIIEDETLIPSQSHEKYFCTSHAIMNRSVQLRSVKNTLLMFFNILACTQYWFFHLNQNV